MSTTVQFRVDPKTKQNASKILEDLGMDLSTGVKLFLRQVIRQKGIPFALLTENGYTVEQEEELLRRSQETLLAYATGKRKSRKSFASLRKELLDE